MVARGDEREREREGGQHGRRDGLARRSEIYWAGNDSITVHQNGLRHSLSANEFGTEFVSRMQPRKSRLVR